MTATYEPSVGASDRIAALEAELDEAARQRAADQERLLALQAERDRLQDELDKLKSGEPQWRTIPGGAMTSIEGTILFDSGKAELRAGAQGVLNEIANVIQEMFADHDVYVFGHTDNEPIQVSGWEDNYELSCQRALSVTRYLQSRGAPVTMLAGGWGENRPVAENATPTGKQANRRVEIYAVRPMDEMAISEARP